LSGGEGNFSLSLARTISGHKPLENQVSKTSFSGSHSASWGGGTVPTYTSLLDL